MGIALLIVYMWGGLTLLLALLHIDIVAEAVNELTEPIGLPKVGGNIKGKPAVMVVVFALWPAAALIWAFMHIKSTNNISRFTKKEAEHARK